LERALALLEAGDAVEVRWLPFELNPQLPREGIARRAYREAKFGSWERSQALDARVAQAGAEEGLEFAFERMARTPNTLNAHRLLWLAAQAGKQAAVAEALFRAYFTEGQDVGDPATLVRLGTAAGLDAPPVETMLASDAGAAAVREAEALAHALGVSAVPTFRVNDRHLIEGAQPPELLAAALRQAQTEAR
jgi:predicted DsbA family dithiol-disulfide isomerase